MPTPSENPDGGGPSSRTQPRQQLPTALQLHILSFLPHNDRALSGRLACRELHEALSRVAYMFQPLPAHAAAWAKDDWQHQAKVLPFRHKLELLGAAAASGSEANLEVAWAWLRSSLFPEALREGWVYQYPDPGEAAVEAGHPQLLPWLLQRCPGLVRPLGVMRAAAWGCNLAGMETAWEALQDYRPSDSDRNSVDVWLDTSVLEAAAQSDAPDAEDKVEWALADGARLYETAGCFATSSGDVGRLRWLHGRGCPMSVDTLKCALEDADLAMARWLVDEAGVELPAAAGEEWRWKDLLVAASKGTDGVKKLQWLREQGAPHLDSAKDLAHKLALAAVRARQVEVVRHLLSVFGADAVVRANPGALGLAATESGSVPMAECLRQAGLVFTAGAYEGAAHAGKADMVWWLAQEAGVSAAGLDLGRFVWLWRGPGRLLLEMVQMLVGEAGCSRWNAEEVLRTAARRGDLALVQYLLQQRPGHRPGWKVLVAAAEGGCEVLLEWLVGQHPGCLELQTEGGSPYVEAARQGDLGTLAALRRLGVPWGAQDLVLQAVRREFKVSAMRWLVEHGAPVGDKVLFKWEVDNVRYGRVGTEDAAWLRSLVAA